MSAKGERKFKRPPLMVNGLCILCGQCDESCNFDAILDGRNSAGFPSRLIDPELCRGCRVCIDDCPVGAIIEGFQPEYTTAEARPA